MFDTIGMTLKHTQAKDKDFLSETTAKLDNVIKHNIDNNNSIYATGDLKNLYIKITEKAVTIKQGSLAKYYLGNNTKTLNLQDVKLAIEKLSNELQLPMEKACITRLDIAGNILTKYKPNLYFDLLGFLDNFDRLEQQTGLYYNRNKIIQLAFYDKIAELKQKNESVENIYQNQNLLRFELRLKQRIKNNFPKNNNKNSFKYSVITASLLYDEYFYVDIVNLWYNYFQKIDKINSLIKSKLKNIRRADDYLLQFIIKQYVKDYLDLQKKVYHDVRISKSIKDFRNVNQIPNIKKRLKDFSNNENLFQQNDLITELNEKIKRITQFYI